MGKLLSSHRYNLLTLLHSCPGDFQRELVVKDLPICKGTTFIETNKFIIDLFGK